MRFELASVAQSSRTKANTGPVTVALVCVACDRLRRLPDLQDSDARTCDQEGGQWDSYNRIDGQRKLGYSSTSKQ